MAGPHRLPPPPLPHQGRNAGIRCRSLIQDSQFLHSRVFIPAGVHHPTNNQQRLRRAQSSSAAGPLTLLDRHTDVRAYLLHRQRVLDVKPVVDSASTATRGMRRSVSVPQKKGSGYAETEKRRLLQQENERLLGKLIKISGRPPSAEFGSPVEGINRSRMKRQSSVTTSSGSSGWRS